MSKFRKKPVVIEAPQWQPGVMIEGVEVYRDEQTEVVTGQIRTLEGWMKVSPGDWVITGIKGEKYPCRDDIFQATYEAVSE